MKRGAAAHPAVLQEEVLGMPQPCVHPQIPPEKKQFDSPNGKEGQNKPTRRDSSIFIYFILQNATQQKVGKPTTNKQQTNKQNAKGGGESLICSFFHSSKLLLTSFLQCKYCRLVLHTNNRTNNETLRGCFGVELLFDFSKLYKDFDLLSYLESSVEETPQGTISSSLKKKKKQEEGAQKDKFPIELQEPMYSSLLSRISQPTSLHIINISQIQVHKANHFPLYTKRLYLHLPLQKTP